MVKLADIYTPSGDFLKSEALKGADPVDAKIMAYNIGEWNDGSPRFDLALEFAGGKEMKWTCNATNGKRIAAVVGTDDIEEWIGKSIVLYHDPSVEYGGNLVGGIRVKMPEAKKTGKKAAFLSEPVSDCIDDEIPF